ncbi:MAG: D-aminoacylase [Pirellulales bacterium]|nr:D-aminoacylase [Pirellulales bacterium]
MVRSFSRRTLLHKSALTALAGFPMLSTVAHALGAEADQAVDADVVLRGGTLVDGSGKEGFLGDVAIAGDRIVAVGRFRAGKVAQTIDCRGLVVAPGFIDLHTHCDRSITVPDKRNNRNYLMQGCTTVVTGNCGGGKLDTAKYFAEIEKHGAGTNVIHLIPQGSLRASVMGLANRRPTGDEMKRMRRRIDENMRAGAWGMSTGLIYVPSVYADTDELVELAKQVARHRGIYASHIRGEEDRLLTAVAEAIEIGRRAGVPAHISHFKANCVPNWGRLRDAAALVDAARKSGQSVTADQYPYIACATSIYGILLPVEKVPGGYRDLAKRIEADPKLRRTVRELIVKQLDRTRKVLVTGCKIARYRGRTLAQIAAAENKERADVVLEIIASGKASAVNFSMSEDDVRYAMKLPWVATASDGAGALASPTGRGHPRSMGTFARKIGRYAIEEKVVSLAHAIRSATGLPADILGLADRGYLRPDYVADVAVFDPATYRDRATFEKPRVYATGVRYLYVAGHAAIDAGRPSEKLFGRALRHPVSTKPAS